MSLATGDEFDLIISNLDAFYYFFLPDCPVRPSSPELNRSDETGHPWLLNVFLGVFSSSRSVYIPSDVVLL